MHWWSSKCSEAQMPVLGKHILHLVPDFWRMALYRIERLPWCLEGDSCHDTQRTFHSEVMLRGAVSLFLEDICRFFVLEFAHRPIRLVLGVCVFTRDELPDVHTYLRRYGNGLNINGGLFVLSIHRESSSGRVLYSC